MHTAEVRGLLNREKERTAEAWQRVNVMDQESRQRLALRDVAIGRERKETRERVRVASETLEKRVHDVEYRCLQELDEMRQRLSLTARQCGKRIELEERRKKVGEEASRRRKEVASERIDVEDFCTSQHADLIQRGCYDLVDKIEQRVQSTAQDVNSKVARINEDLVKPAVDKVEGGPPN